MKSVDAKTVLISNAYISMVTLCDIRYSKVTNCDLKYNVLSSKASLIQPLGLDGVEGF